MLDSKSQDEPEKRLAALASLDKTIDRHVSHIATIDADIHRLEREKSRCFEERNPLEQKEQELSDRLANEQLTHEVRAELGKERANVTATMKKLNEEIEAIGDQIEALEAKRDEVQRKLDKEQNRIPKLREGITNWVDNRLKMRADPIGYVRAAMADYLEVAPGSDAPGTSKPAVDAAGDLSLHMAGKEEGETLQISIRSSELESRIQAILDQLTDRRIAEEMDTTTYLFRLETAFKRARDRATHLKGEVFERFYARITEVVLQVSADADELKDWIEELPDRHFATEKPVWIRRNDEDEKTITEKLDQLGDASKALNNRLRVFVDEICADGKFDDAKDVGRTVSRHIEKGTSVRFWPLLVALITAIAAKLAINVSGSSYLATNTGSILLGTFGVAYVSSLWFGIKQRKSVMDKVQSAYKDAMNRLFAPDNKSEDFRFQKLDIGTLTRNNGEAPALKQLLHFDGKRIQCGANIKMYLSNGAMIVVILAMLTVPTGLLQRLVDDQPAAPLMALHGQNPDGSSCLLATGYVTGESEDAFQILSAEQRQAGLGSWLFPELYAFSYAKPAVHAVRGADGANDMARCDSFIAAAPLQVQQFSLEAPEVQVTTPHINGPKICEAPGTCPPDAPPREARLTALEARLDTVLQAQVSMLDLQTVVVEAISRDPEKETGKTLDAMLKTIAALLEELKNRPQISPQVVEYHFNEAPDQPDSLSKDRIFWTFSLIVNEKEVFRDDNAVLIKFFPPEVNGTRNEEELAYQVGRASLKKSSESDHFAVASKYYLDQLVQQIRKRLESGEESLLLNIHGFASDPWKSETDRQRIDALNHALAEGRRAAVLDYLAEAFGKDNDKLDALPRLSIRLNKDGEPNSGACLPLAGIHEKLDWKKKDYHAFQRPDEMKDARGALLKDKQIVSQDGLAHFVGRSTLVEVEEGKCL